MSGALANRGETPLSAQPNGASSVSVAMATCNGGAWIDAQLASLVGQTRQPDELVVCDDASDDSTLERVRAFAETAPFPVRIEPRSERIGATANFEQAIALCQGDIVFLADQDDVWLRDKISDLASILDAQPRTGAVFCNGTVIDADDQPLGYDLWQALAFSPGERRAVAAGRGHEVFARHVVAAGTGLAFRRRFVPWLRPFPPLRSAHDAWVAALIAGVAEVACVEQPLIHYRLHGANQIGLRRFDLRGQYQQARRQLETGALDYAAAFFEAACERLAASSEPLRPGVLDCYQGKLAHARWRCRLPRSPIGRAPRVVLEAARGGYRRYGYGWKSAAQDLLLR